MEFNEGVIMSIKWFQCQKCNTLIKQDSTPSSLHCSAGSTHSWHNLGELGSFNYQCKKCGTTVQCKNLPSSLYCPTGATHSWHKL